METVVKFTANVWQNTIQCEELGFYLNPSPVDINSIVDITYNDSKVFIALYDGLYYVNIDGSHSKKIEVSNHGINTKLLLVNTISNNTAIISLSTRSIVLYDEYLNIISTIAMSASNIIRFNNALIYFDYCINCIIEVGFDGFNIVNTKFEDSRFVVNDICTITYLDKIKYYLGVSIYINDIRYNLLRITDDYCYYYSGHNLIKYCIENSEIEIIDINKDSHICNWFISKYIYPSLKFMD